MDFVSDNYYYMPTRLIDSQGYHIMRCVPKMESNVIMVYEMGNTTKVVYRPTCIAPGVDTHHVHDYNVASGWALSDERTKEERKAESIRTSVSRSVRAVRELAACNPWQFFVTITLSPAIWPNRYTPDGLQDGIVSTKTALRIAQTLSIFLSQKCTKMEPFTYTALSLPCPSMNVFPIRWLTSMVQKIFP